MKRSALQLAVIFSVLWLPAALVMAQAAGVSLDEYRRQIRDLSAQVDSLGGHPEQAAAIQAAVPDKLTVHTSRGEVTVSYSDLKSDLTTFYKADPKKRSALLPQIQNYVHMLAAEAEEYDKAPEPEAARKKLADILARREFRNVGGPSAKDVLLAKLFGWLIRWLNKISFGSGSSFDWFHLLVYLLIAAAMILILIWTLRRLRRPKEEPARREIVPFAPSARSWRAWLAEARSLAQQQDWRNAIHLAYWAGISFLEEHGAWKPDRARTPREYLRLVGARTAKYPALSALTRQFEIVWYGHRDAAESDFRETLAQLERLGCR